MPGIKAVGTNTAESTSAIPTTGPESSSIAFKAAFFGVRPSSMWRSTPSTTTMASSTTRPIASTRPKRESVLMDKPNTGNNTNVPTSETGTARSGITLERQAALRENGVGKFLALRCWFAACLPGRVHCVLRLNSADDFGNSDAQLCQLVGFYPQPHRVLAGTEYLNVADTRRAREGIGDIDVRVVRQKLGIVRSMRRVQRKEHHRIAYRLSDGNPEVVHIVAEEVRSM